jgi:hypothetical protein
LVVGLAATPEIWPSSVVGREIVKESDPIGSFEGAKNRIESIEKVEAAGEFMGTVVSRAIKQNKFNPKRARLDPICPLSSLIHTENIVLNPRRLEPKISSEAHSFARLASLVKWGLGRILPRSLAQSLTTTPLCPRFPSSPTWRLRFLWRMMSSFFNPGWFDILSRQALIATTMTPTNRL